MENETSDSDGNYLDDSVWLHIPRGALSGPDGGLKLLLDVESFDSAYSTFDGLVVAFLDQRDLPVIAQDGFMVSPGKNILPFFQLTYFTHFLVANVTTSLCQTAFCTPIDVPLNIE